MIPDMIRCVACARLFDAVGDSIIAVDRTYENANPFEFVGTKVHIKKDTFKEWFADCEVKRMETQHGTFLYALYHNVLFMTVEDGV